MKERQAKYRIGQKFKPIGKKSTHTVKDIYYTRNTHNELISIRYVCEYLFCDQVVTDYDVPESTIARSMQIDELDDV
jgi:hypothetical protein